MRGLEKEMGILHLRRHCHIHCTESMSILAYVRIDTWFKLRL